MCAFQFAFTVYEDDDDVMMQLMQKSVRSAQGSGNTTIGFTIMKVSQLFLLHFSFASLENSLTLT